MKRAADDPSQPPKPRRGGIKWDEENLEENEKIKQELNPRKIDEPKTPYLSPLDTDDEAEMELGVGPLSLEDGASGPSRPAVRTHRSPWSDSEGTSNGTSPSAKRDRSLSRSPRFSEEYYRGATDDEEDIADPEAREKRRRFLEARKRHYRMKEPLNMKEALRQGQNGKDEEEEDDDSSLEENGSNGVANGARR